MKNLEFIKREAINWIFILLPFIYMFLVHDKLPRFAPFQSQSDQDIFKIVLINMGVVTIWYFVYLIKPSIVPQTPYNENLKSYHRMRTIILGFISLITLAMISQKIGIHFNWVKVGFILSMVYLAAIGNLYPTIRHNFFIGIRNSWTQNNEHVWKKTHSFAGKVYFWGGLAGALYGIIFNVTPVPYWPVIFVSYVFFLLLVPQIYSYLIYRQNGSKMD
jgi:uncharacterized membrane protein